MFTRRFCALCLILLMAFSSQSYAQAKNNYNYSVGQIDAHFDVSSQGSATYSIPIQGPAGTAGLHPNISLSYSSQSPASAVGIGWSIEGMHVISRGARNLRIDGQVSKVNFDRNDALYFNGQRLIPVNSSQAYIEYRTLVDDGSRIRAYGISAKGPQSFTVETKSGLTIHLGKTDQSRINAGRDILAWVSETVTDTLGNYIEFKYLKNNKGDYSIKRILYTGNKSENLAPYASYDFEYVDHDFSPVTYLSGRELSKNKKLNSITTRFKDRIMYRYELKHSKANGSDGFILSRITQVGADGKSFPPTVFQYSETSPNWKPQEDWQNSLPNLSGSNNLADSVKIVDINKDGMADFMYASLNDGILSSFTALATNVGWNKPSADDIDARKHALPIALSSSGGARVGVILEDIDGDDVPELMEHSVFQGAESEQHGYIYDDGWRRKDGLIPPIPTARNGKVNHGLLLVDVDGEGKKEIIYSYNGVEEGYLQKNGDWVEEDNLAAPLPFYFSDSSGKLSGTYAIDVDCDASKELVYHRYHDNGDLDKIVYKYNSSRGWEEYNNNTFILPFEPTRFDDYFDLTDVNGDGCEDILISYKTSQKNVSQVWLASKDGWQKSETHTPNFLLASVSGKNVFYSGVQYIHLNKDNLLDVVIHDKTNNKTTSSRIFFNTKDGWLRATGYELSSPIYQADTNTQLAVFADVNNDKLSDIIYLNDLSAGPNTLVNDGSDWVKSSNHKPPVDIAKHKEGDQGVRFVDFNGDGLVDIIKNQEGSSANQSQAFRNSGRDWQVAEKYKPPIALSGDKGKDIGARLVDINSDGLADYLYAKHNEEKKVFVNSKGWKPSSLSIPSDISFLDQNAGDMGTIIIDLNGDGRSDIISSRRDSSGKVFRKAYINKGNRWEEAPQYNPCYKKSDHEDYPYSVNLCVDFVSKDEVQRVMGGSSYITNKYRSLNALVMDVNGDRLPDILFNYELSFSIPANQTPIECQEEDEDCYERRKEEIYAQSHIGALLNTGRGWRFTPSLSPKHKLDYALQPFSENYVERNESNFFNDLNGDGLVDHIYVQHQEGQSSSSVYLNTGASWTGNMSNWQLPSGVIAKKKNNPGFAFIDLNGDSLLDILYSRKISKDSSEKGVHFNRGGSWGPKASGAPDLILNDYVAGDPGTRILDVNGDGLPDLVQSYTNNENQNIRRVLINNTANSKTGGRADVLVSIREGMGQKIDIKYRSQSQNGGKSENNTDLFYERGEEISYPLINVSMPIHAVSRVKVSEKKNTLVDPEGFKETARFEYTYSGFRIDLLSGEPRGYAQRVSKNKSRLKETSIHSTYYQDEVRSGLTKQELHRINIDGDFRLLRTIDNEWSNYDLQGIRKTVGGHYKYWVSHITESTTETYDIGYDDPVSTQKEAYEYSKSDNYQNVQKSIIERSDGLKTTTVSDFNDDDERWIKGRVSKTTVSIEHPDENKKNQTRTALFEYSPYSGLLEKEVSLADSEFSLSTYHLHDGFGNTIATITCPSPHEGDSYSVPTVVIDRDIQCGRNQELNNGLPHEPRTNRVEFDSLGRLVVSKINSLQHQSDVLLYDEVFGLPLKTSSINGVISKSAYNSFGQIIESESSTKLISTVQREFLSPNERGAYYSVTTKTDGLPPGTIWYDIKGRELRTISTGEGSKSIIQESYYDVEGRLVEKTVPVFEGEEVYSSRTTYDFLGRPVQVVAASGQTGCYIYDRNTTVHIDDAELTSIEGVKLTPSEFCNNALNDSNFGRRTTSKYDFDNNLVFVKDALGGELKYEYDIAGRVIEVNNNDVSKIITHYDYAGNKTDLIDPDMGHWKYRFNVYGELIYQVDAKQQSSKLSYDRLGRLLKKETQDGTLNNEYDRGDYAKGKLISVISSDGYRENYSYDQHTRLKNVEKHILGKEYTFSNTYDPLGRVVESIYPSGFVTKNHFDDLGLLRCVTQASIDDCEKNNDKDMFWYGEYNARNQVIFERFGNSIKTDKSYDSATGLTKSILVKDNNRNPILSESYLYDLGGNLEERRLQGYESVLLEYEYDALDRLRVAKNNGLQTTEAQYDLAGNIRSKTGVGDYQYGENGSPAHGVSSITKIAKGRERVSNYKYDANGNLIESGKKSLEYNASNQVISIRSGRGKWSKFRYSNSGQKYYQDYNDVLRSVQTTYVGNYEEIKEVMVPPFTPSSEKLRKRHFIVGGSGVVAAYEEITWFFPTRHFPDIYKATSLDADERSTLNTTSTSYFHTDYLGSVAAITDTQGNLVERLRYDPWGKRVQSKKRQYHTFTSGFTGHEHLDNVGFIHMNGRVYDPDIGRFVSADPFIQFPHFSQSYNRYSYVLNNPLKFVDPSGYLLGGIGDALGGIGRGLGGLLGGGLRALGGLVDSVLGPPLQEFGRFMNKHGRTIIPIAAGIVVGMVNPYAGAAVYGFMSASMNGASMEESLRAAAISAATAYVMGGISEYAAAKNWGIEGQIAAQSTASGIIADRTGGNFSRAFWSAGISRFVSPYIGRIDNQMGRVFTSAMVGGTISSLNNGKFENGAVSAGFSQLFTDRRGRPLTKAERKIGANHPMAKDIDFDKVRVHDYKFSMLRDTAVTPNNNIYMQNPGSDPAVFLHELTHVWQHQQGVNVIAEGIYLHVKYGEDAYDYYKGYGPYQHDSFSRQNIEQQGQIIQDCSRYSGNSGYYPCP